MLFSSFQRARPGRGRRAHGWMALCVRPLVIGSQGNDLRRAPYRKCVPFCPNSNTAIVARPRKRQQQSHNWLLSFRRIAIRNLLADSPNCVHFVLPRRKCDAWSLGAPCTSDQTRYISTQANPSRDGLRCLDPHNLLEKKELHRSRLRHSNCHVYRRGSMFRLPRSPSSDFRDRSR